MDILGISAYYHDSAAAFVRDGDIMAAAQEERFTRHKHDAGFPCHAIEYCLSAAGVSMEEVDYVVFYDKPFLKFERLLETYLAFAPHGFRSFKTSMPSWLNEKLFLKRLLKKELGKLGGGDPQDERILFSEHHLSHAASAFYASPFNAAAILTMDGVGEWATTSVAIGQGNALDIVKEIFFPHSLGLLYSAFTYYTGFKVNSGEYKLMGLAPYGEPKYAELILDNLIDIKDDGSFRLDMAYFDYCTGLTMTNERFDRLFGGPPRKFGDLPTRREMDLAASVQFVIEEVVLRLTRAISRDTGMNNLCLAGGVALNCVANGKVLRDRSFERIWVQPAAGDAGGALGAALAVSHGLAKVERVVDGRDKMKGAYLGPEFSQLDIEARLTQCGATFETMDSATLIQLCAQRISQGYALGWFQGRMEFGPRSLGGRSILGDPRVHGMQRMLNTKIKFRESFRPFAPSVLREHVSEWFDFDDDSPYMLLVANVAGTHRKQIDKEDDSLFGVDKLNVPRSDIPAVTHVDYSARIQTVHKETNPLFHSLISKFHELTGCPILVNTSFNVRGEPVVCTPEEAFNCFMGTDLDMLAIGNCILFKEEQSIGLRTSGYHDSLEKD